MSPFAPQSLRYTLSGLAERKDLASFDWNYNLRLPIRKHGSLNHFVRAK